MNDINIKNIDENLKGINMDAWGGIDNFLRETSTGAGGTTNAQLIGRVNPWMAKARDMHATAISELPFNIVDDNDKVIDSSKEWKNKLGGIPYPNSFMYLLASSLTLGKAYIIPQYTSRLITDLHFCAPHTVTHLIDTQGLRLFARTSDFGQAGTYAPLGKYEEVSKKSFTEYTYKAFDSSDNKIKTFTTESGQYTGEMMYFWLPDADVEIGPARSFPAQTALLSAELITAIDATLKAISEQGFIPPTLLSMKGAMKPGDIAKAENVWSRFLRRWTDSVAKVINGEVANVLKVGAGMEELKGVYNEIKTQAIEDLGAGYGIPSAIFQSDKAFASEVDPMIKVWYSTSFFMKCYQCIEQTFNTQLLSKFGYKLKFDLNALDAFHEDEMKKATSYRDYISTDMRPSIAAQLASLDLPEGTEYKDLDEFYEKRLEGLNNAKPVNPINDPSVPAQDTSIAEDQQVGIAPKDKAPQVAAKPFKMTPNEAKDYSTWYDMSKRFMGKGKALPVDFECKFLPAEIADGIRTKLSAATTELDIVKAFEIGEIETKSDILILAEAINNAVK